MIQTNKPQFNPTEIDTNLRIHIRHIVLWRLSVKIHIAIFIMVNLLLFAINQTSDPSSQWWLWAFTGWFIPLAIHTFFVVNRKKATFFRWHLFLYVLINLYLFFIDFFANATINWAWIPLLAWSSVFILNLLIKRDISKSTEELAIFAVLLSDTSGKTLLQAEQKPQFLKDVLHMNESNVELIPMCINAILQFSKEINMMDCDDFRLQNKEMKVVSFSSKDLVCTGFISLNTNSNTAREVFRQVLISFQKKFPREITDFINLGISTPFENYKLEIQKMIQTTIVEQA